MEGLYAEFLLWKYGFQPQEKYEQTLHERFLRDPAHRFLLKLEEHSTSIQHTGGCFARYWAYEHPGLDASVFGKALFSGLKRAYFSTAMDIGQFARQCYSLWQDLPSEIDNLEPFLTLCYADDPLSWGDEVQTKALYEKAFAYLVINVKSFSKRAGVVSQFYPYAQTATLKKPRGP